MRVLGIDTATWAASVGVIDDERVLSERSLTVTGSHAATLLPLVDDALAAAGIALHELDLLAVSIGPGAFTGLRIALSVAKGLALATGAAIVGVPTLEAHVHAAGPRPGVVCPVLDARKREVYAALFRWSGDNPTALAPDRALTPHLLAELVRSTGSPCTLVGEGVDAYRELWTQLLGPDATLLRAAELAPLGPVVAHLGARSFRAHGAADLAALEPVYVRRCEAEVKRDENRATYGSGVEN